MKTNEKRKRKRLRMAQLNDKDVFRTSLFPGDGSKTNEGGSQDIKVREGVKQGTRSRRF